MCECVYILFLSPDKIKFGKCQIQMTSYRTSAVFLFLILTFIPSTPIYNICMSVLFEISMHFLLII